MWIRSFRACSAAAERALAGLVVLVLAGGVGLAQHDPVTEAVAEDPFIQLRLAALAEETPEGQGQALKGLVDAELARGLLAEAEQEAQKIADLNWQARALIAIADYHVRQGRPAAALTQLRAAAREFAAPASRPDTAETIRTLVDRLAALDAPDDAVALAKRLPDSQERVRAILDIARKQVAAGRRPAAAASLEAAQKQAQAMKEVDPTAALELLLETAELQAAAAAKTAARQTLQAAENRLSQLPPDDRDAWIARLAAAEFASGDRNRAMTTVRAIGERGARARALASVARAMAVGGDMESALPLFTHAFEEARALGDAPLRHDTLRHVMVEQTRAGRLADAFATAGHIRDRSAQAHALGEMGRVLVDTGRPDEALKLVDYIPVVGLRAPLFVAEAERRAQKGDIPGANEVLSRALEPTGASDVADPDLIEPALDKVIAAQMTFGTPAAAEGLFKRILALGEGLPDPLARARLLSRLAVAEFHLGDPAVGRNTLAGAARIAWLHKEHRDYARTLAALVSAYCATGNVLDALDTAVRIAPPASAGDTTTGDTAAGTPDPDFRLAALHQVAETAALQGNVRLAIRTAKMIDHRGARAGALAAVAVKSVPQAAPAAADTGRR